MSSPGCERHAGGTETRPASADGSKSESLASRVEPSNLKSDENAVFIPTFATLEDGQWKIPLEVWVFEPEDDGPVRKASRELVEETLETVIDDASSERVAENMKPFMVDNERNKTVVVKLGDRPAEVGKTGPDGRASATVSLPVAEAEAIAKGNPPVVEFEAVLREGDTRHFTGRVQLLADEGVSVLSDIDDTIKITEVHDKKKLLENTFARAFRPTPGVAGLYRRWAEQGAAFHYVSNSPLPLLGAIETFLVDAKYPLGSVELKPFRWTDGTFLELFDAPEDHKQHVIEADIDRFARRRFILVGDTGERDPEIYAALRRKYGDRITKIYVRDTGSMPDRDLDQRMKTVFEGIPPEVWTVFEDGAEVSDDLPSSK